MLSSQGLRAAAALVGVALVSGGLLAFGPGDEAAALTEAQIPPNIVVLITDDEPALDGRLITWLPTIKSLFVDQGVTFTDFHPPTNWCCPARASYLSGQYVHNHHVEVNDYLPFDPSMTIATQLQKVGYYTFLTGKYLNGYGVCEEGFPCPPGKPLGWDRFIAFGKAEYYDYNLWLEGEVPESYGSNPEDYSTDVISRKTVSLIESAPDGKPLFAWIGPKATHVTSSSIPMVPAERHKSAPCETTRWQPPNWNEADRSDKPDYLRRARELMEPELLTRRCRTLLAVDDLMKDVKDALAREGRLSHTVFVYLGDNGMFLGEHRVLEKVAPHQNRVPFYMSFPASVVKLPRTIDEAVSGEDLAPTLCAIAGCTLGPYPGGRPNPDGKSFLPLLFGVEANMGREVMFSEQPLGGGDPNLPRKVPGWWAVTSTSISPLAHQGCEGADAGECRWHYIEYATGEKELYDLYNGPCWEWQVGQPGDPCRLDNAVSNPAYASIVAELKKKLEEYKNK